MADTKLVSIILTGVLTGALSSGSTYFLQREEFRRQFQGSLIAENLNEFVGACVTENREQRTFFMRGVAEALECEGGEVQRCVIEHVRTNCGRFVSPLELEVMEEAPAAVVAELTDNAAPPAAAEAPAASTDVETRVAQRPSTGAGTAVLRTEAAPAPARTRLFMHVASVTYRDQLRPLNDAVRASNAVPGVQIVRGIEVVEGYDGPTHVRYFLPQDRAAAEAAVAALRERIPDLAAEPRLIEGYANRGARVAGLLELWLNPNAEIAGP